MTHARTFVAAAILSSLHALTFGADEAYLASLARKYPWEGAQPGSPSFFEVASIKLAIQKMVPASTWRSITEELTTGSPNELVSGYLIVSACKPHDCPGKNYIAITNLRNSSVAVVIYDASSGPDDLARTHCFADAKDLKMLPDAVIEQVLEMHIPRTKQGDRLYPTNRWIDEVKCLNG